MIKKGHKMLWRFLYDCPRNLRENVSFLTLILFLITPVQSIAMMDDIWDDELKESQSTLLEEIDFHEDIVKKRHLEAGLKTDVFEERLRLALRDKALQDLGISKETIQFSTQLNPNMIDHFSDEEFYKWLERAAIIERDLQKANSVTKRPADENKGDPQQSDGETPLSRTIPLSRTMTDLARHYCQPLYLVRGTMILGALFFFTKG